MLSATAGETLDTEALVRFRMEITDPAGSLIRTVEAGKEFAVNVYVTDQRPLPEGVFAAYLDLVFDDSVVEKAGHVTFGDSYPNAIASGGAFPEFWMKWAPWRLCSIQRAGRIPMSIRCCSEFPSAHWAKDPSHS